MDPLLLLHICNCWRQIANTTATAQANAISAADASSAVVAHETALVHLHAAEKLYQRYVPVDVSGLELLFADAR